MNEETINKLYEISDLHTRASVGILLKRLENLNLPPEKSLTFEQLKIVYSNLIKDTLYEQNRAFKKLISAYFTKGTIIFE